MDPIASSGLMCTLGNRVLLLMVSWWPAHTDSVWAHILSKRAIIPYLMLLWWNISMIWLLASVLQSVAQVISVCLCGHLNIYRKTDEWFFNDFWIICLSLVSRKIFSVAQGLLDIGVVIDFFHKAGTVWVSMGCWLLAQVWACGSERCWTTFTSSQLVTSVSGRNCIILSFSWKKFCGSDLKVKSFSSFDSCSSKPIICSY